MISGRGRGGLAGSSEEAIEFVSVETVSDDEATEADSGPPGSGNETLLYRISKEIIT